MTRESLAETRRSVWNLRPPSLEGSDLIEALQNLLSRPLSGGATAHFSLWGAPWPLAPDVESALLRVTQEALSNVNRHSHANDVWVEMIFEPESIQLHIRDNGQGFDPQSLNKPTLPVYQQWGGFGLIGMCERIEAFGGHLTIESESQQGVHVYVVIPHQNAAFALMRVAHESSH